MKYNRGRYELSTGKTFNAASSGILGIGPTAKGPITAGYDEPIMEDDAFVYEDSERLFTPEEKREIATFMVGLWREWGTLGKKGN